MNIQIHVATDANGAFCVIPARKFVEAEAKRLTQAADQLEHDRDAAGDDDLKKALETRASGLRQAAQDLLLRDERIRDRAAAQITVQEFPFILFTYGQKMAAKDKHTTYDGGTPRLNVERYIDELTATAVGMTAEKFYTLHPAIAEQLRVEVMALAEPDPEKMDFLS